MEIFVMNREEAEEYCTKEHTKLSAIVSITTTNGEYANLQANNYNNVKQRIRLRFDDVEDDSGYSKAITERDAANIADFVKAHIELLDTDVLIVHCDAGKSRSAGVVAAIIKYLYNDSTPIFNNSKYTPNMKCYREVYRALISVDVNFKKYLSGSGLSKEEQAYILLCYIKKLGKPTNEHSKQYIKDCLDYYNELMSESNEIMNNMYKLCTSGDN